MASSARTCDLDRRIAHWLSEARLEAGKTLNTLSVETGIPVQKLQAMEMGLEAMSAASMFLIEDALECGLPIFLRGGEIAHAHDQEAAIGAEESQFEACLNLLLALSRLSSLDKAYQVLSVAVESQPSPKTKLTKLRA